MKIVHVIRDLSLATGGPATALSGMAKAQARHGHDVTILATDRGGPKVETKGVTCYNAPAHLGAWAWSPMLHGLLERLIPAADIVHLHMVWDYPVWAAARAAVRHGKPFILRPCGQLDAWSLAQKVLKKRLYMILCGTALSKAAAFHFTAAAERESAQTVIGDRPYFVIPNGVSDEDYFKLPLKGAFIERFPQLADRRIVLFLGRLHAKKQPEVLIDAFATVAADFPRLHLVLAGPGEVNYVNQLRSRVAALGIERQTTFTGPLFDKAVAEAYVAAEMYALPSLQENFGNAVIEAMAAACPVLISDRVALAPEIAKAGAGIVASPTRDAFVTGLAKLLADQSLRERMGASGRRLVLQNYIWDKLVDKITTAYQNVLFERTDRSSQLLPNELQNSSD